MVMVAVEYTLWLTKAFVSLRLTLTLSLPPLTPPTFTLLAHPWPLSRPFYPVGD